MKEIIIAILNEYKENLEGYSYYGKVYGVSEDDFEEVAEKIKEKVMTKEQMEKQLEEALQVIGYYANNLNWVNDFDDNRISIEDEDHEFVVHGCASHQTDDLTARTGGKKAREFQEKHSQRLMG